MKKVYIIGDIPQVIDQNCELKFYNAQMSLNQRGFSVVNPIEKIVNTDIRRDDAIRKNLQDLIMCDAVYILPCVNLVEGKKNIEIMYAINFNLLIMHAALDLISATKKVLKNKITKKIKVIKQDSTFQTL